MAALFCYASVDTIYQIAKVLGCTLEDLIEK